MNMTEIDLIPVDYRAHLQRRSTLLHYGVALLLLNASLFGIAAALGHMTQERQLRAASLKAESAITQQQQAQLQQLKDREVEYNRRWSLLRGLRAGAAVDDIFSIIDRSIIPGELWFLDWSFRRAGVIVDGQQRGVETGYFVIVADDDGSLGNHDLSVETHMTINGQAKDHQALSRFVRALFEQPDIKDVNVQRTSQVDYASGRVVGFDMTVVLNNAMADS